MLPWTRKACEGITRPPKADADLRGPTRASSRFEKMKGRYSETVPTRVTFPISARGDENSRSICRNLSNRHFSVDITCMGYPVLMKLSLIQHTIYGDE